MDESKYNISSAQALFDFLCEQFGYDWEELMNRKNVSGTLGSIRVQHEMFDMYKYIQAGDCFLAWRQGFLILKDIIEQGDKWTTAEDLRSRAQFLYDASYYLENYEMVQKKDREDWLVQLQSMRLLTVEEKKQSNLPDICPRQMIVDVDKMLMNQRLLRIFRYKGFDSLRMDGIKTVNVGENFIMANNIGDVMVQGKDGGVDELNVYISLNIDDILDFSYFLIAFNNGENWWFVTDQPDFANPGAKESIAYRGSARFRRDDYENSIFPYVYLDRIEDWRKENSHLDKIDGIKREMYTVPLSDWPVQCRAKLNMLIEKLLPKLQEDNGELQRVKFGYEYTNALLLENKKIRTEDWKKKKDLFDYADSNTNEYKRIENMIFPEEDERALMPVDASQVAGKISVWNGNLMTEEKFAKLEAWSLCDIESIRRMKLLEKVYNNREADKRRMLQMLDNNFHKRVEALFSAKNLSVFIYEPDMIYKNNGSGFNCFRGVHTFALHSKPKDNFFLMDIPGTVGGEENDDCKKCKKYPLKKAHISILRVHHYAFLAWMAGVKREQLPHWFINYTGHIYQGYAGNHLLSNVNPVLRVKDGLSDRRPNGLMVGVRVCQRCRTIMNKQAIDKGILVINKLTCESEGLFSEEEFKSWLSKKNIDCKISTVSVF